MDRPTVSDLDTKICDFYDAPECDNEQTFRQFIRESEDNFGIAEANLDAMSNEEFLDYLDHLDYLWEK